MHLGVGALQHHEAATTPFIFAVHQYSSLEGCAFAKIEHGQWQPGLRYRHAVSGKDPLPVPKALHRPQCSLQILAHQPLVQPGRFGQSHALQRSQPGDDVLVFRLSGIPADREVRGLAIYRLVPGNCPVKRREPLLRYFAALGLGDIRLRAVPELPGTEILSDTSNAMLHVVTFETERSAVLANPTQRDVNVRVIGIEVRYGNPFEASIEIPYHALRQVAGQPDQVHLVSKLRRQDELPQACIAGGLPLVETSGDLETSLGRIKPGFSGAPLAGTLPGDVAPMC